MNYSTSPTDSSSTAISTDLAADVPPSLARHLQALRPHDESPSFHYLDENWETTASVDPYYPPPGQRTGRDFLAMLPFSLKEHLRAPLAGLMLELSRVSQNSEPTYSYTPSQEMVLRYLADSGIRISYSLKRTASELLESAMPLRSGIYLEALRLLAEQNDGE